MGTMNSGEGSLRSPDRRPCFYKVIWKNVLDNSTDLRIPPDFFSAHLESEEAEEVTLKGPLGIWGAKLEQRHDGVYMVRGWKDFVARHSLGDKEVALFLSNGGMSFDVKIFEKSGCLMTYQTPPLTSPNPFFVHKMKGSNVGHKCIMVIPKAFSSKNHLPMSKQKMLLRDSEGISWSVSIIVMNTGNLAISGGWKSFTDAHSIKEGDVCVFELVEPNLMQVHILR